MIGSIGRWARLGALGTLVALAACTRPSSSPPAVDPGPVPAGGGGGGGGGQAADLPAGTAPIQAVAVPAPAGAPGGGAPASPTTPGTPPSASLPPGTQASPSGFFPSPTPIPAITPLVPPSLPPWWRGMQPDGVCPPDVLGDVDCPPGGGAQRPR